MNKKNKPQELSILFLSMAFLLFSMNLLNAQGGVAIIADHTIVDQYDNIPQNFVEEVKKCYYAYLVSHMVGVIFID